ncbi:MAG TPA: HRDC domain-containing protein [Haliangium sp.]|nr:HRDC domain-containing protein [Haliangium sp.]
MREVAGRIAAWGRMVLDLEFASDGRFLPELSLVQVAWGDPHAPEVALVDCLAVDPGPILELVGSDAVETVAHAARQDLAILAARFGITAHAFWDTQIAAAFTGMAEQIGYGKLVHALLGVELDKGAQFTAWLERPLSTAQHRYAVDDVRYLTRAWAILQERLQSLGRLHWVGEESQRLADDAMPYGPAEQAYLGVKGRGNLDRRGLARLRALAAWRQEVALAQNLPLSWILPEQAMLELSRRGASNARDLRAIAGIGAGIVQRHGEAIFDCLARARQSAPPPLEPEPPQLDARGQMRAAVVHALIQARSEEAGIAARFVGTRADAEALVAWHAGRTGGEVEGPLPLLSGWRRTLVGEGALAWLRGEAALVCTPDRAGLALVTPVRAADGEPA